MAVQIVRRPGVDVEFVDAFASRKWILDHVADEIRLTGQPHPKVYLLGKDFVETFDVHAMTTREPGAHIDGRRWWMALREYQTNEPIEPGAIA